MNPGITIKDFEKSRLHLQHLLNEALQNIDLAIYDPWLKFIFEKEVKDMVQAEHRKKFPDIPIYFNFSIYIATQTIEYGIQRYYHPFSQHKYLGCVQDIYRKDENNKPLLVDCYYSSLYESFSEPRIIVRYGHAKKETFEGAMSAATQFYQGADTALAKGYQLALEAGYVKQ